jgi:uncharacterized membrane protein YiaA
MKTWLASLFSCGQDSVSTMRLMSLLSLLVGAVIAFVGLMRGADLKDLSWLVGVFVTSAFGGKAIQKGFEK